MNIQKFRVDVFAAKNSREKWCDWRDKNQIERKANGAKN